MILKNLLVVAAITVTMCSTVFADFSVVPKVGFNLSKITRDESMPDEGYFNENSLGTLYKIDFTKEFENNITAIMGFGNSVLNLHEGRNTYIEGEPYNYDSYIKINEINLYAYAGYQFDIWKFALTPKLGYSVSRIIDASSAYTFDNSVDGSTSNVQTSIDYDLNYQFGLDVTFIDKLVLDVNYTPMRTGYDIYSDPIQTFHTIAVTLGYKLPL